jgi:hypothetical protein
VAEPQFSKGYWIRTLNYLRRLESDRAVKLPFRSGGVPRGVEKSIYAAASRKGMDVSVFVRGAVVYICDNSASGAEKPTSQIRCHVCDRVIDVKSGVGKQYVCAGFKKKTECQKTWRYSREQGISLEEAKQRREETARRRGPR